MFETKGAALLPIDDAQSDYLLGLMNSSLVNELQTILSPTLDYHEGPLGKLPILNDHAIVVRPAVADCGRISQSDWDSQETSWDFKRHALL